MPFDGKYLDLNQKRIKGIIDHFGHTFMFQKKILDLGCGHGDIAGALYRLGADVTAVDIRQEHLKITGKKFPGIKTVKADLDRNWPFVGKQFDIILDLDLMNHINNFEVHLKALCASTTNLVLDAAVCDSLEDKSLSILENKNIYDLAINGQGCRPTVTAIERVLKSCGFTFTRLDNAKFNSNVILYNWIAKNDNSHSPNQRRIWFATKNPHMQVSVTKPTDTVYAFNAAPNVNQILQNSNQSVKKEIIVPPTYKLNYKPKIALCISGHLRTFDSNFKTVKEHILDKFDCDTFIHTWDTLGLSYRPGDSNLHIADTHKHLHTINQLYSPKKIVIEKAKHFNITPLMHQRCNEHRDIHGILAMFYKIEECNKLRQEYELENNFKYDFVIRFRGDLWLEELFPIDNRITSNHLYLPIYGNFGGACDQMAFGSPDVMDKYCSMYSNVEKCLKAGCWVNPEKLLLFHLETQNVPIAKAPIRYVIRRANGLVQDNMLLERAWGWVK